MVEGWKFVDAQVCRHFCFSDGTRISLTLSIFIFILYFVSTVINNIKILYNVLNVMLHMNIKLRMLFILVGLHIFCHT